MAQTMDQRWSPKNSEVFLIHSTRNTYRTAALSKTELTSGVGGGSTRLLDSVSALFLG